MKGILGLSANFIDYMTNPVHGDEINQTYASRFIELTQRDEGLIGQLAADDLSASDTDLLSMQSWLWYLKWLATRTALPRDEFLTALYADADDSLIRLIILDSVLAHPAVVRAYSDIQEGQFVHLNELPPSWPRNLLLSLVSEGQATGGDVGASPTEQLETTLEIASSLLQITSPSAMALLRGLLQYPWQMQDEVARLIDGVLQSSGMSASEVDQLRHRLGLI
ncbi:hypothetical protein [Streptomyces sp. NPDC047043]|uniref:hypothetical protein n=1 Tax=Streptomyces sp. NPDC047043 TaxID=3154497 RepID=UPI0033E26E3E